MRILRIDIENFRCIKKLTLQPHPSRNVLIGPSNAGKSTILEALSVLLSPEHSYLTELDFSRFDIFDLSREPGVVVRIGASMSLAEQEWQYFEYLEEPKDVSACAWGDTQESDTTGVLDDAGCMLRAALFYQWDREHAEDRVVCFFPKFGLPGNPECRRLGRRQREALGFWLAPYDDPLWEIATLSTRSHLSRKARQAGWDPMGPEGIPSFVNDLVRKAEVLSQADKGWQELGKLSTAIMKRLQSIVPGAINGASLGVTASLTDAWAQRVLELGICQAGGASRIPLSRQGAGMQRAFMIAAHSVYARNSKGASPDAISPGVLALDEPEVGLHPQAQRAMLSSLASGWKDDSPQAFVATHSPAIVQASEPADIWVVRNEVGQMSPTSLGSGGHDASKERMHKNAERHWQTIAPALFADAAVVVEGATEEGALPAFDQWARGAVAGYPGFDAGNIAVVNAGGIGQIAAVATPLAAFGCKVIAIHDYDVGGAKSEDAKRRTAISQAANLVLHMPDLDEARCFELMMAMGLSSDVLRKVLTAWSEVYDEEEKGFAEWVRQGLPEETREAVVGGKADEVMNSLVECYAKSGALADGVRHWFATRCGAKPTPDGDQAIFCKSARYARVWAEACVSSAAVPIGIRELFTEIGRFLATGMKAPSAGHVIALKVK